MPSTSSAAGSPSPPQAAAGCRSGRRGPPAPACPPRSGATPPVRRAPPARGRRAAGSAAGSDRSGARRPPNAPCDLLRPCGRELRNLSERFWLQTGTFRADGAMLYTAEDDGSRRMGIPPLWQNSTMALNIKDKETEALVAELAALTGETKTEAVRTAARERLERLRRRAARGSGARRRFSGWLETEIWSQIPDEFWVKSHHQGGTRRDPRVRARRGVIVDSSAVVAVLRTRNRARRRSAEEPEARRGRRSVRQPCSRPGS